jgi:hypothetical protein
LAFLSFPAKLPPSPPVSNHLTTLPN